MAKQTNKKPGGTTQTATQRVYEVVKQDIITCRLPPGEGLYEGQLAERLGVSKTPVREALTLLVQEGFVDVRPRQGYRVTDLTLGDVQELFQMRLLLEPAAAELAAKWATDEQLEAMRSVAGEYEFAGAGAEDSEPGIEIFHLKIAEASGNRRLTSVFRKLLEEMARLFYISLDLRDSSGELVKEHYELLDALVNRDAELARKLSTQEIETSRRRVIDSLLVESPTSHLGPAIKLRKAD